MGYLLYVAVGGLVGSVLRYLVNLAVIRVGALDGFPVATACVNILGCMAIGVASHLAANGGIPSPAARTFIFAGLLGGFTTFSAFANETGILFSDSAPSLGLLNILVNVGGGLSAVWIGRALASIFFG